MRDIYERATTRNEDMLGRIETAVEALREEVDQRFDQRLRRSDEILSYLRSGGTNDDGNFIITPQHMADIERLVNVLFNKAIQCQHFFILATDRHSAVDPTDVSPRFTSALAHIELLKLWKVMTTANVPILEAEDKEISNLVNNIDIPALEFAVVKLAEIVGLGTDKPFMESLQDDFEFIKRSTDERPGPDDVL